VIGRGQNRCGSIAAVTRGCLFTERDWLMTSELLPPLEYESLSWDTGDEVRRQHRTEGSASLNLSIDAITTVKAAAYCSILGYGPSSSDEGGARK
jgi:hypothetical protein